jgi:hypothetical protein
LRIPTEKPALLPGIITRKYPLPSLQQKWLQALCGKAYSATKSGKKLPPFSIKTSKHI